MLNAKELSDKIAEYRSLLWLQGRYNQTQYASAHKTNDLVPAVFHQAGPHGILRTNSKDIIEALIKNAAINAIETQIKVLQGEFKRMKISLEGIEA